MGFFSKKVRKPAPDSPPVNHHQPAFPSVPQYPQSPPSQASVPWAGEPPCPPQPQFQPAGYLPPPPGWNNNQPPPPYQYQRPPVVVNQHYYILPPPQGHVPQRPQTSNGALGKLNMSMVNLANEVIPGNIPQFFDDGLPRWHGYGTQLLNQSAALVDQISERFNDVMTRIDGDRYAGNEKDLFTYQPTTVPTQSPPSVVTTDRALPKKSKKTTKNHPKGQTTAVAASVISGGYFAKVDLYANSRLPMNLPPLKLYIPTYPLLCLAAQYSERVYEKPRGAERDAHVDSDFRTGTKAMVIKSVPMDHMNTIVFAIRGTATFMDWAVNLNMAPTSPAGFLDDPGNFCHAGFLSVARKMVPAVAARLRQLLAEDPGRASYSLLITGHSAGGAVAALLYSHMLATSAAAASELNQLAGCFRRIHCVTFGAPPVSLLPLAKPDVEGRPELRKSLFLSFVNEGDPVARADKAYVRSLLELFATPAPTPAVASAGKGAKSSSSPPTSMVSLDGCGGGKGGGCPREKKSKSSLASAKTSKSSKSNKSTTGSSSSTKTTSSSSSRAGMPTWKVPPCVLSSAGRIVVLRSGDAHRGGGGGRLKGRKTVEERLNEGVVAQIATDEQLRGVIWGDPVCHVMKLYAGRLDILAIGAVTGKGG